MEREIQADRLHCLIETQRLINAGSADADRVITLVLDRAQAAMNADGVAVELLDGDHLVCRAARGVSDGAAAIGQRHVSESALSGQSMRLAAPLICRDVETDASIDGNGCRAFGVRSVLVAPLVHAGEAVGVLRVLSTEPGHFSDADADTLELLANFIAWSLANSMVLERDAERILRDPLTGLFGHAILMDRISQAAYGASRYGRHFGLFFIDLNHFSVVNDALGYEWGDVVLRAVAEGLSGTVRAGDTLARLESDRFVILAENAERSIVEERLKGRVDAVLAAVNEDLDLKGFDLTASIAVIWSTDHGDSAEGMLSVASEAANIIKRQREARDGFT